MAFVLADRVKETSTTTGTGTYDLAGAVSGFRTFVAGVATGSTCPYFATMGADWEIGIGTVTDATPDTLARTTILKSSNANAAVSWASGTKTIALGWPADRAIMFDRTSLADGDFFQYDSASGLIVRKTAANVRTALNVGQLVRPTLVQVKSSISETSTIVLDSAPTAGSWLVWMNSYWTSTTVNLGGAVASNTYMWETLSRVGGNAADGTGCFVRRVKSGESATIQLPYATGVNGQNLSVFEVAGGRRPVIFDTIVDSSGDPRVLTGVVDDDLSFMVGMFANTGNSSDDPSITGSVATVTEGTRATGTSVNGSPRQINPFYCNIEKGSQTITADYSSARVTNAVAVVFPPNLDI